MAMMTWSAYFHEKRSQGPQAVWGLLKIFIRSWGAPLQEAWPSGSNGEILGGKRLKIQILNNYHSPLNNSPHNSSQ
jgi:hypothetical protein